MTPARPWSTFLLLLILAFWQTDVILAQTLDLKWTKPYAEALEKRDSLVLLKDPLEKTLTRIELVGWLTQVFSLRPDPTKNVPLTDLPKDSPDFLNAQAFIQAGLGTAPDGKFQPQGDYTRLESLALFGKLLKLTAPTPEATTAWINLYKDGAGVAKQGKTFVAAAGQAGLIINYPDPKELGPDYILTRGEGIVLLYQALVYQKKITALAPPIAQLRLTPPVLTAIEVSPLSQTVKPGQSLTITAKGTPGSKANFALGDLVQNQPLKETQPGVYTGTYKVKPKDYLDGPAVSVTLSRSGLEDRKQKIALVTLGNQPYPTSTQTDPVPPPPPRRNPPTTTFNPPPDDPYYPPKPYNPPTAYNPPNSYPPPTYPPSADDLSSSGDPPRITQVAYNGQPGRPFYSGDYLEVTLKGEPGGRATFFIDGYTAEVAMKEETPGFYRAKVKISRALDIPAGVIRIKLAKGSRLSFESIPEQITIVPKTATTKQF